MLNLDSPKWAELEHAYGTASDIPELLRQLESLPSAESNKEPWFSIWSGLTHQGDVFSASFAAVPHVVRVMARAPAKASAAYFQFPAWVEICRQENRATIPTELKEPYFEALARLPALVAGAAAREWDSDFLRCALSAIAVSKGSGTVARAVLEIDTGIAEEFLEWFADR